MTSPPLNYRLTPLDAVFLYAESPRQPMHMGAVLEYDRHISRDEVIEVMRGRMHLLPRYRQKVVFPPFGLAHPTWEDDPDFDVANHVEEVTLPPPGDDRVLSEIGGRAYARMLDRNRPLWKLVLMQGRPAGNTAIVAMVHHAMVDGISGVDLTIVMHDTAPDAPPPVPPAQPWRPRPIPDAITRIQDAVRDRVIDATKLWTDEFFRLLRPDATINRLRKLATAAVSAAPALLTPISRVWFNAPLSAQRQFAWVEFSLPRIRFVKSVLGGTVNDVVLAVVSGGMRRYLRAHTVSTRGMELRALCPVSMRQADGHGTLGNVVSTVIVPLYVDIADPVERLKAERRAMEDLKDKDQAGGIYTLNTLTNAIPTNLGAMIVALAAPAPNTVLNTVSTNVPGPQTAMYLAGRQLVGWYPLGPLAAGIGLFNAQLSYNGKLTFGATVDPNLVPDAWFYIDCLKESFAELLDVAVQTATATGQGVPETVPAPANEPATVG